MNDFSWFVLVEGSPLKIDEVGRYLKKFDGVDEVRFIESTGILRILEKNPTFGQTLENTDPALFPSCWRVTWIPERFDVNKNQTFLTETLRLPGVLDVAFNEALLSNLKPFKRFSQSIQLLLAMAAVLMCGFFIFVMGGLFFDSSALGVKPLRLFSLLILHAGAWLIGFLWVGFHFGFLPWPMALGGVGIGFLHAFWPWTVK